MTDAKQQLIDQVIEQIIKDVTDADVTALEELLKTVPVEALEGFLPDQV